jgi:undecaprenyl diphosphate synthase
MEFIRRLYIKKLEREVLTGVKPQHIVVVANADEFKQGFDAFQNFTKWCNLLDVKILTICLHVSDEDEIKNMCFKIPGKLRIITPDGEERNEDGTELDINVNVILGYGGRIELLDTVRKIAAKIKEGKLRTEDVDAKTLESFLKIREPPDLIIRAGEEIPDFLIWQSIYSELYFTDIRWESFRYIDFLRCIREYQRRERRYGK